MRYTPYMKRRSLTVTSKNQITLPADLVRKYKLDENRVLEVRERNGVLELRPTLSLEERMQETWKILPPFTGTKTDADLKQAIRNAYAEKKV